MLAAEILNKEWEKLIGDKDVAEKEVTQLQDQLRSAELKVKDIQSQIDDIEFGLDKLRR